MCTVHSTLKSHSQTVWRRDPYPNNDHRGSLLVTARVEVSCVETIPRSTIEQNPFLRGQLWPVQGSSWNGMETKIGMEWKQQQEWNGNNNRTRQRSVLHVAIQPHSQRFTVRSYCVVSKLTDTHTQTHKSLGTMLQICISSVIIYYIVFL